jgi:hypothetical protein
MPKEDATDDSKKLSGAPAGSASGSGVRPTANDAHNNLPSTTSAPLGVASYLLALPGAVMSPLWNNRLAVATQESTSALVDLIVDRTASLVLDRLEQHPAVVELAESLVARLLPRLQREPQIADLAQAVATEVLNRLAADPAALEPLVQILGDRYVEYLATHPEIVKLLVQGAGDQYVEYLTSEPAGVHILVQVAGDRYIAYLNTTPEAVQDLLQGQSQSLARRLMDEVQDRSEIADDQLEGFVRALLRRKPRGANGNASHERAE